MPWVKGQSGNPKGRQRGVRIRLTERFLKLLEADFRKNGADAIAAARQSDPVQYSAMVARLLPKDTQLTVTHELSQSFRSALLAAQHTRASVGEVIDVTPEPGTDAKPLTSLETQRSKD